MQLHIVDYSILGAYFLITLILGLMMTRRASSSLEHYFLGGRTLPWYLLGIAGMSNWFDMTGTMIITSFLFMLGPRGLYIEFRGGAVLVLAFMLVYAGKWHRRSGCMTPAEWMTYRFGADASGKAVRVLFAVSGLIGMIASLGYLIRGASLFLGQAFPYPPLYTTIVLLIFSTVYTMFAGFYGVVLTDLLQGSIVMLSCFIIAFMAWDKVPDAATMGAVATQVSGNPRWMASTPDWYTQFPEGYTQYNYLLIIAAFYLLRNVLCGMGSGAENRYFGARSDRECGLQSLLQGCTVALRWPLMLGFAVLGIFLVQQWFPDQSVVARASAAIKQHYPQLSAEMWHEQTAQITHHPDQFPPSLTAELQTTLGPDWTRRLALVSPRGTLDPEQVLAAVLLSLPAGLKGALLVAMFAAMMSAKNGMVNGVGALFVKDIYQLLLRPRAGNRELIIMSYLSAVGIVGGGLWMGYSAKNINDIWGWLIMSLTAGGLAPYVLRLYWWRCNSWGIFGGTLVGAIGAITQRKLAPDMPEWQQFTLMTSLSFIGTIGGSYLTPATNIARLRHFFATTRPFGLWGPVLRTFALQEQRELTKEHRNDMIAVPFVLLWQVTLFLLPMQLVIKNYGDFWRTLPLFLVGCAGMYWFWYRVLPGENAEGRALAGEMTAAAPADTA